ncbi:MAG: ABC transporter ATP-binding protein [Granulosicoccus sp.]
MDHTDPVLSMQGVSKRFGALQACKEIFLQVRPGEIHALIGPNGAGKTTLIKQIAGFLQPDAGQIYLNGGDVTKLDVAARARLGIARTFQVSELAMQDTVLQNALLGVVGAQGKAFRLFATNKQDKKLRESAEQALQRLGLEDQSDKLASALSHGQRRLLEIAVALTLNPSVFVMDEPMAGLGTHGTRSLVPILDQLRHEAPILMVEHDMDAVFALADRVSVLVYGQIIATGSVDDIRQDSQVRSAYLGEEL